MDVRTSLVTHRDAVTLDERCERSLGDPSVSTESMLDLDADALDTTLGAACRARLATANEVVALVGVHAAVVEAVT
jgi:hypothetical protein